MMSPRVPALALAALTAADASAGSSPWLDTFYQYRLSIVLDSASAGWHVVPIESREIVTAMNRLEEMSFELPWFAYNHFQMVELDEQGQVADPTPEAGFYLVEEGEELTDPGPVSEGATVTIPTEEGAWYLLRYVSHGGGTHPAHRYRQVWPIGHPMRSHKHRLSFEPRILPLAESEREQLILADGSAMELDFGGRFVQDIRSASLKRVQIVFLANLPRAGRTYWTAYYQPLNGHHLVVPRRRRAEIPAAAAKVMRFGGAEKYVGATRYQVAAHDLFDAWFAETTVKLTPDTPVPNASRELLRVSSAARESQSFQVVLRPRQPFRIESVSTTELRGDDQVIAADQVTVRRIEFLPIVQPSYISPVHYVGPLADALVELEPTSVQPPDGNLGLWVTITTPPDAAPGIYRGAVRIATGEAGVIDLPLELEVYDFALPEFSPFRSSMGGAHLTKSAYEGEKTIADYHGVTGKEDVKKLARAYYDMMARHKFTPHSVVQYSEIGMNWKPPPEGYNVDAPGNYFQLVDWDFTEWNADLRHFIDKRKVNAFVLVHTNPSVINRFKHLPGKERLDYDRHPPHVTLAWQTFREATVVGYDKHEGEDYQEITRDQYDHLVMDFYRALARNLEANGWLDAAYILIDETATRGYGVLVDFIRLLKSDPLTARIQVAWCLQSPGAFSHKEDPEADDYAFNNLLDIYVPETNENVHYWEDYYFTDYGIEPRRERLWNYITYSTRVAIDTPGINNRMIGLEVFKNGGSGFLVWGTFVWDSLPHSEALSDNPWETPYTRWGNGAMTYFYPPRRDGPAAEPDFTIIPSLRVETYRESVDDYEYAWLLEREVAAAEGEGRDTAAARAVLADIARFFDGPVHWSQNDAWYLELRDRMAREIVRLRHGEG